MLGHTARLSAAFCLLTGTAFAEATADPVTPLPMDEPMMVGGIDAACTGIGDEAQTGPRWRAYPIRIEFAGGTGQYVGNASLTLHDDQGGNVFTVSCEGPWLLLQLPAGKYKVTASADGSAAHDETISVPASGQARAVIRFPEIVGTR